MTVPKKIFFKRSKASPLCKDQIPRVDAWSSGEGMPITHEMARVPDLAPHLVELHMDMHRGRQLLRPWGPDHPH